MGKLKLGEVPGPIWNHRLTSAAGTARLTRPLRASSHRPEHCAPRRGRLGCSGNSPRARLSGAGLRPAVAAVVSFLGPPYTRAQMQWLKQKPPLTVRAPSVPNPGVSRAENVSLCLPPSGGSGRFPACGGRAPICLCLHGAFFVSLCPHLSYRTPGIGVRMISSRDP